LISKPLSDEDSSKINQIIINKESKTGDIYIYYENKKVSWGSMRRLLNLDTTEKVLTKRWINDEVINFHFKKYLAEMDQKRCKEEPKQNCSGFLSLFFWQTSNNVKHHDKALQGMYSYENVSRWLKKLPGEDIFNLKKIFIPINIENQHWTCIVIFMKEKQIQYYDSNFSGTGKSHMDSVCST
jgi:Ulp1 family protease